MMLDSDPYAGRASAEEANLLMQDLPNDPALPNLNAILDATFMRGVITDLLRGVAAPQVTLQACRLERFRYRAGAHAIVLYDLEFMDRDTGTTSHQWVTGSIFAGGKARKILRKLKAENRLDPIQRQAGFVSPSYSFVDDMELLVQWYPADRHMPEIASVFRGDNEELTDLLAEELDVRPQNGSQLSIEPMRYRPGVSATVRISLSSNRLPSTTTDTVSAYVKMYRRYDRQALLDLWGSLAAAADASNGKFSVPRVLGATRSIASLSILPAKGRSLEDLLVGGADPLMLAKTCAEALFALQRSDASLARRRSCGGSLARFQRACRLLKWASPSFEPRIDRIHTEVSNRLVEDVVCPAHLDLKADHIFIDDEGKVTFIDLDSAEMADPMLDPAQLIARLDVMPCLMNVDAARIQSFRDAFLTSTLQELPAAWTRNFAPAYAFASIKVALYFLQHLQDRWRDRVDSILLRVERELAIDGAADRVPNTFRGIDDPYMAELKILF